MIWWYTWLIFVTPYYADSSIETGSWISRELSLIDNALKVAKLKHVRALQPNNRVYPYLVP